MAKWPILKNYTGYREVSNIVDTIVEFIAPIIEKHQRTLDVDAGPRDFVDKWLIEMKKFQGKDVKSAFNKDLGIGGLVVSMLEFCVGKPRLWRILRDDCQSPMFQAEWTQPLTVFPGPSCTCSITLTSWPRSMLKLMRYLLIN